MKTNAYTVFERRNIIAAQTCTRPCGDGKREETRASHTRKDTTLLLVGISARCHGYNIRFKVCVDEEKTPIVEEHWRLTACSNG